MLLDALSNFFIIFVLMEISYFKNAHSSNSNWNQITRDERFFCFELYQNLKTDQTSLLQLIKNGLTDKPQNDARNSYLNNIGSMKFDFGVEVCFYRDLLKWNDIKIGKTNLPRKRTFDLALFTTNSLVIIEAKCQQGFHAEQLREFESDKKHLENLFIKINKSTPEVYLVGLHSSLYNPKSETKIQFDSLINWIDLSKAYSSSKELFERADSIYRK